MSYEYQLEGRDDGWIAITGRSEVTYYDLPSGSYVFKVRRMGEPDSETLLKVEIASVFSGWLAWGIVVAVLLEAIISSGVEKDKPLSRYRS